MKLFMNGERLIKTNGYEKVIEINRPEAGLRGFFAIHDTTLGPAVGGTRMYPYSRDQDALEDVLRLSRAMTYKCALAGVSFGGGKGVIIGDPKSKKTKELLIAYAEEVNKLEGAFYTGEDVGLTQEDVSLMLNFSPFFIGRSDKAGDPSPHAAYSTFISMKSACKSVFGNSSLKNRRIVIKGVGKVGSRLADFVMEEGAILTICDIDQGAIEQVTKRWPSARVVEVDQAHREISDVFAPCALGNEITEVSATEIQTKIICGSANNQLASENAARILFDRGIVYVPDYIANAGGLINVVDELNPSGYNQARVKISIQKIEGLVNRILKKSISERVATNYIADSLAESVLNNVKINGRKNNN